MPMLPPAPRAGPPPGEALRPLLEPLASLLYDALRPRFVQLSDIDSLVDLIDILQGEVGRLPCVCLHAGRWRCFG